MIDLELFKNILSSEDEGYIESGDFINNELLLLFTNSKVDKVKKLFKSNNKNSTTYEYTVEIKYVDCGYPYLLNASKTSLFEIISSIKGNKKRHICNFCKEQEEKIENEKRMESESKNEVIKKKNTDFYISTYLSPDKSWNGSIKAWSKLRILKEVYVDWNLISKHIKEELTYSDFLKTPYWKGISEHIRIKSNYRCKPCGENGVLNVHHSRYDNHGDEIHHLDDLICICKDCHSKFHDK